MTCCGKQALRIGMTCKGKRCGSKAACAALDSANGVCLWQARALQGQTTAIAWLLRGFGTQQAARARRCMRRTRLCRGSLVLLDQLDPGLALDLVKSDIRCQLGHLQALGRDLEHPQVGDDLVHHADAGQR